MSSSKEWIPLALTSEVAATTICLLHFTSFYSSAFKQWDPAGLTPQELGVTELRAEAGFEVGSNMLVFWLPHVLCKPHVVPS